MSRIKGHYIGNGTRTQSVRWLEPSTGKMYESEAAPSQDYCHSGFRQDPDGTWIRGDYVWQADATPELTADWYIMRMDAMHPPRQFPNAAPNYVSFGPFTEEQARAEAVRRAGKFNNAWAVLQLKAGNTVVVQPPAPPAPVTIWS